MSIFNFRPLANSTNRNLKSSEKSSSKDKKKEQELKTNNKENSVNASNIPEDQMMRHQVLGLKAQEDAESNDGYTSGESTASLSSDSDRYFSDSDTFISDSDTSISTESSSEPVEKVVRSDVMAELQGKLRLFKGKNIKIQNLSIPDILSAPYSQIVMKEVCPAETLDSEAAQQKAKFKTEKGIPLSEPESKKLKAKLKCIPSNHLLISSNSSLATRSGRVDTATRVKQVVEDGAIAIYDNIDPKLKSAFDDVTDENRQEKNNLLKGTGFVWKKSKGEIKLHHKMNLTTAMDSKKSPEGKYFTDMKKYCSGYSQQILLKDNLICSIEQPLFTVSPQSAFGHELKGEGVASRILGGQKQPNITEHKDQLTSRIELLKQSCEDYGVGDQKNQLSENFKILLDNDLNKKTINTALTSPELKPQEKLFLKYVNYIKNGIDPSSNKSLMPINSKLIFEVGIDAFDSLSGISSHKSCKSGQDRTLTQISFQAVLAENNYEYPEKKDDKAIFAAKFFENAAMQATPVIEFARDTDGKIKWEIGSPVSEQPIPGKMNDWFSNNKTLAINYLAKSCKNSDGTNNLVKKDHLVKGLKSLNLKSLSIELSKKIT